MGVQDLDLWEQRGLPGAKEVYVNTAEVRISVAKWESISDRRSSQAKILRKGTTEQVWEITNKSVQWEHHLFKGLAGRREQGGEWLYPNGSINQARGFRTSFGA